MSVGIAKKYFDRLFSNEVGSYGVYVSQDNDQHTVNVGLSDKMLTVSLNVEAMPTDLAPGDKLYFHIAEVEEVTEAAPVVETKTQKSKPSSSGCMDKPRGLF